MPLAPLPRFDEPALTYLSHTKKIGNLSVSCNFSFLLTQRQHRDKTSTMNRNLTSSNDDSNFLDTFNGIVTLCIYHKPYILANLTTKNYQNLTTTMRLISKSTFKYPWHPSQHFLYKILRYSSLLFPSSWHLFWRKLIDQWDNDWTNILWRSYYAPITCTVQMNTNWDDESIAESG